MTPQIALAMLLLSNLALLVLYIHMEWQFEKLKKGVTEFPVFIKGAKIHFGRISYDERNHTYKLHGMVFREDLRIDTSGNDRSTALDKK